MNYLFFLIISFLISLVLTFLLWKIGESYKIYDWATKDPLKIHQKSISCLGGLAMILSVIIVFSLKMILERSFNWQIVGIIIAGALVFLLGFRDDLKWRDKVKIKPIYKFFFLILFSGLSALIILKVGLGISSLASLIGIILTFGYIFVLINAVNYQDGMDGIAGGTVAISLIGFSILSVVLNNGLAFTISLVSMVTILVFLIFNFPPGKIFMGDSGAYFLGFILAVLAMIFSKPYSFSSILGLIFILGLPLFDGIFTNIRRLLKKKSIFLGDREHFYDKMINKGFSIRKTVFISYFLQTISVLLGLLIYLYV